LAVTTDALKGYVDRRTAELAEQHNLRQRTTARMSGNVEIVDDVEISLHAVTVRFPAGGRRIVVRDRRGHVVHDLDVTGVTDTTVALPPGMFSVTMQPQGQPCLFELGPSGPFTWDLE
jgi:hypothetical protein